MKVSIIISACSGRERLFKRSLLSLERQTLSKKEFEVIMVDDADRYSLRDLCRSAAKQGLRFRYIRVDPSKSHVPPASFTPALTNNVGFRHAEGDVIVVTGPETIHGEWNVEIASEVSEQRCEYGLVFRADKRFETWISSDPRHPHLPIRAMLQAPGAQADCRTRSPHPPAYWYWMAVRKTNVEAIGGCDEEFMRGICGDDDDFANRMKMYGVVPVFNHSMIGIHQDHSNADMGDNHSVRFTADWGRLQKINRMTLNKRIWSKDPVANRDHIWGDPTSVISVEEFK